GLVWIVPVATAAPADTSPGDRVKQLRRQGQTLEKQGQWAKACDVYDEILQQDRSLVEVRKSFQRCFRRLQQVRRHRDPIYRDPVYRKEVLGLTYLKALHLYEAMLASLQDKYVERTKAIPSRLFKEGLEEFRYALLGAFFKQSYFRSTFLPKAQDNDIRNFL